MIKKYVKKPIEVEVIQWTGDNTKEVEEFTNWRACQNIYKISMIIETPKGEMRALPGDYIIKDANGECYPCKADIFKETYEEIRGNKMTNFEKIKNMSIDEMVKIFCKADLDVNEECPCCDCTFCTEEWLKAEAKEYGNDDTGSN